MLHFFCQLLGIKLKFKTLKFFTECFSFNKVFWEDFFSQGHCTKFHWSKMIYCIFLFELFLCIKVHIFHILPDYIRRGTSPSRYYICYKKFGNTVTVLGQTPPSFASPSNCRNPTFKAGEETVQWGQGLKCRLEETGSRGLVPLRVRIKLDFYSKAANIYWACAVNKSCGSSMHEYHPTEFSQRKHFLLCIKA